MSSKNPVEAGRLEEDLKRVDALLSGLMVRVNSAMDEIIREYTEESRALNAKRGKGDFGTTLVPRVKRQSIINKPKVYWEVMEPRKGYARANNIPIRRHIPKKKVGYTEQSLRGYTDNKTYSLVMNARSELERLEAFAASVAEAKKAITDQFNDSE